MRIQRAAERAPAPWKNGGGVTWEVAVAPPGARLDDFDWRISIAEVTAGGPFSTFPGIDRVLSVIAGSGLRLHIDGTASVQLDAGSSPFHFSGDAACMAELAEASIRDLNVMCRRGRYRAAVRRMSAPATIECMAGMTAILALDPASVGDQLLGRDDVVLADAGERVEVAAGNLVVVEINRT